MHQPPPGTLVEPSRLKVKLHWELLVCGWTGHELVGAAARELQGPVSRAIADLQGGVIAGGGHAKKGLLHEIDHLFTLDSSKIRLFGAVIAVYAIVEGIEALGLWYQQRWCEYLTFLVTTSLL